ncbi:hypothetical protein GVAV_002697 [Gurleya vavrai]
MYFFNASSTLIPASNILEINQANPICFFKKICFGDKIEHQNNFVYDANSYLSKFYQNETTENNPNLKNENFMLTKKQTNDRNEILNNIDSKKNELSHKKNKRSIESLNINFSIFTKDYLFMCLDTTISLRRTNFDVYKILLHVNMIVLLPEIETMTFDELKNLSENNDLLAAEKNALQAFLILRTIDGIDNKLLNNKNRMDMSLENFLQSIRNQGSKFTLDLTMFTNNYEIIFKESKKLNKSLRKEILAYKNNLDKARSKQEN